VLTFETLTLAPIDLRLIDRTMLTDAEVAWLNAYHARILPAVGRLLDANERTWLEAATKAL
jgi:Xaa-Pro aminopeptidase